MSKSSEVSEPPKPATPLSVAAIKLRETTNNSWRAVIPRGTPRERLLDSDFWATIAERFLAYDKITCVFEDSSAFCELLVVASGRGYCKVVELTWHPLPTLICSDTDLPANHTIEHNGPSDLYVVRRLSDNVILGKNFSSRQDALAFLLDHASLR